jgi:hypothetical protein
MIVAASSSLPAFSVATLRLPAARRPHDPHARRDRLRISHRLASGMTPAEVARCERVEAGVIDGMLADPSFRDLVASAQALEALPAEARIERLVGLARFTLELALLDGDTRAACFVLREADRRRDPARSLAERALAGVRPPPPLPPPTPAERPAVPAPRPAEHPDARWLRRGVGRLRDAVLAEQALRHTATTEPAAAPPIPDTATAARKALALKRAAGPAPLAALARRLANSTGALALLPAAGPAASAAPPVACFPRRPRAP